MTTRDDIAQWAAGKHFDHISVVVCLGYSDAKPWEPLKEAAPHAGVVVFEPDPVKAKACAEGGVPPGVVVVDHLIDLRTVLADGVRLGTTIEAMGDPVLAKRWAPLIARTADEAARYRATCEHTNSANARGWIDIGLDVVPILAGRAPLNGMPKALEGVTGIVVGAGPSLGLALDALRELQGRVAIIATNSAVGALDAAGIQPDIVCAVEAQDASLAPILNSPCWPRAVLVPGIHCWPGLWRVPARHLVPAIQAVGGVGAWLTSLISLPPVFTGGSVSTLAYRVAEQLGCSRIVLVGMDCARGKTGKDWHAPGVARSVYPNAEELDATAAESGTYQAWGGVGSVKAPSDLAQYREWFEARARDLEKRGLKLINCSEGGAMIAGTTEMRLSVLAREIDDAPANVAERIDAAIAVAPKLDRGVLLASLREQPARTKELSDLAAAGEAAAQTLIDTLNKLVEVAGRGIIHASYTVGTPDERVKLPAFDQLQVAHQVLARVVELAPVLDERMQRALEALEVSNA